jgi:hypothetical protein
LSERFFAHGDVGYRVREASWPKDVKPFRGGPGASHDTTTSRIPPCTTVIDIDGKPHHIVIDGDSGQIASTVPPFVRLYAWLVAGGVPVAFIAFVWWAISWLIG